MTGHHNSASNAALESNGLDSKGVLAFRADSSGVCIGPGNEVSNLGRGPWVRGLGGRTAHNAEPVDSGDQDNPLGRRIIECVLF